MTGPYGVQPTGFIVKPLADIKAELEENFRATFGDEIDVSAQSVFGMLIGIFAFLLSEVWLLGGAIYSAMYPDSATGVQQDNIAAITGTARKPPTLSKATVTAFGSAGTALAAGRVISVNGTGIKFETTIDATIGDTGQVDIPVQAQQSGPKTAPAGTLTVVETPVAGWDTVTNALDAEPGTDLEADVVLRIRREQELRSQGNAAHEAIRQKLLLVSGVTNCIVFENETDTTDADGIGPHGIEVLVSGGTDAAIRAAIFAAKASGIKTYGTVSGTVTDAEGNSHTIKFTRPTDTPVYVVINLTKNGDWPSDGVSQVQAAVVLKGDNRTVGDDVITSSLYAPVFSVSGVVDVTDLFVGFAPAPGSSTNLTIAPREIANFDTSRITVNVS